MRTSILAVLSLVCLLTAPLAFADTPLVAEVPFSFIVNNKVMPAGSYSIDWGTTAQNMAVIQCQGQAAVVTLTSPYKLTKKGDQPALVFHRFGSKHFLSRIRSPQMERQIPKSKGERELLATRGQARTNYGLGAVGDPLKVHEFLNFHPCR